MKKTLLILFLITLSLPAFAYRHSYSFSSRYYSTGYSRHRSMGARNTFLRENGYSKVPSGYQVDHIQPLSEGGADTPSNMQLLTIPQHEAKTNTERQMYGW